MKEIISEIEINAPAKEIWEVLTNFAEYPEWNAFIPNIEGALNEGGRLKVRIAPPGALGMKFSPRITSVVPQHELRWMGKFLFRGLFDGEHIFQVEPLGLNRSRFVQREIFKGLLVSLLWSNIQPHTEAGFIQMNEALKARVELRQIEGKLPV